jgi:sodium-dependent dicarboxylate transporter 2/3/5
MEGFAAALMLAIAYSASIGGVATLIGTPPNVILAGFLESNYNVTISFSSWILFGLPLAVVMITITWYYLTHFIFKSSMSVLPGGMGFIEEESRKLGPLSSEEKKILTVFTGVAACWIVRGFIKSEITAGIADSTIAIVGALVLFIIPTDFKSGKFLLDWKTAAGIPWDIIILFGGGLSLANGFKVSGLDQWIGARLTVLQGAHYSFLIAGAVLLTIFLTEITSNTATAAMIIPIMAGVAISMSIHPLGPLLAACIAASYAFMLPVATPPNAVVFGSKRVNIIQMVKAGLALNIISWIVITILIVKILPVLWKIDLGSIPDWPGITN